VRGMKQASAQPDGAARARTLAKKKDTTMSQMTSLVMALKACAVDGRKSR